MKQSNKTRFSQRPSKKDYPLKNLQEKWNFHMISASDLHTEIPQVKAKDKKQNAVKCERRLGWRKRKEEQLNKHAKISYWKSKLSQTNFQIHFVLNNTAHARVHRLKCKALIRSTLETTAKEDKCKIKSNTRRVVSQTPQHITHQEIISQLRWISTSYHNVRRSHYKYSFPRR